MPNRVVCPCFVHDLGAVCQSVSAIYLQKTDFADKIRDFSAARQLRGLRVREVGRGPSPPSRQPHAIIINSPINSTLWRRHAQVHRLLSLWKWIPTLLAEQLDRNAEGAARGRR
jgi:hypothetical protein